MMSHQRGYILFMTFSMLALCTALVSMFMAQAITHKKLASALLEEDANIIFLYSTPAIVQSFLAFSQDDLKKGDDDKKQNTPEPAKPAGAEQPTELNKLLLKKVLPVVNKVQKFNLKELEPAFPVAIDIILFCEAGKINLNGLYDLTEKKFYDEGVVGKDKKAFTTWLFDKIAGITGKPSLLQPFIDHLKQRKSPFNDVTELLSIKEFADCFSQRVFYAQDIAVENFDKNSNQLFLTDIFTVSSENGTIQPWLLSPSLCVLLDIMQKNSKQETSTDKEQAVDLSAFKSHVDWQKDWDLSLKKIYTISYDKIPEKVRCMLAPEFSVTTFSAMITMTKEYGDGEKKKLRIFAILKEKKLTDNSIIYDLIKIYQV